MNVKNRSLGQVDGAMPRAVPTEVQCNKSAGDMLRAAKAYRLRHAIGALEGLAEGAKLTVEFLRGLGSGTTKGVRLIDCVGGAEKGEHRKLVVGELLKHETKLAEEFGKGSDPTAAESQRVAQLAIGRLVAAIEDQLAAREGKPTIAPKAKSRSWRANSRSPGRPGPIGRATSAFSKTFGNLWI